MIVFLAGMPRSGSTFAFNIAREMLKARGGVYQCDHADVALALCEAGGAANILLKAHVIGRLCVALAQRHAVVTICTVRRVEDAVASWMEIFGSGEDVAIDGMRAWLALYRQIRPFALTVPYALLDTHPFRASWRIARHVAADAGVLEVRRACTKTRKAAVKGATDRMDVTTPNMVDIGFSAYTRRPISIAGTSRRSSRDPPNSACHPPSCTESALRWPTTSPPRAWTLCWRSPPRALARCGRDDAHRGRVASANPGPVVER